MKVSEEIAECRPWKGSLFFLLDRYYATKWIVLAIIYVGKK
jgi:hypothetical protein